MPARGELVSVKGQAWQGTEWGRGNDDGQGHSYTWAIFVQLQLLFKPQTHLNLELEPGSYWATSQHGHTEYISCLCFYILFCLFNWSLEDK